MVCLKNKAFINNWKNEHSALHSLFTFRNILTDKKHYRIKHSNLSRTAFLVTECCEIELQSDAASRLQSSANNYKVAHNKVLRAFSIKSWIILKTFI